MTIKFICFPDSAKINRYKSGNRLYHSIACQLCLFGIVGSHTVVNQMLWFLPFACKTKCSSGDGLLQFAADRETNARSDNYRSCGRVQMVKKRCRSRVWRGHRWERESGARL